jgi:uncharacterized protein involved in exopolysaccharide biosynthesis
MILTVIVFAGIFLGSMFGQRRGAFAGCAAAVVVVGALMWTQAPKEYDRQLRLIERKGLVVQNAEEGRAPFVRAVRIHALLFMLIGFGTLLALLILRF